MTFVLIGLLSVVGIALRAVAQSILTDEVKGWLPHISRAVVKAAARRLPPEQRARYEEEWLAEVFEYGDRPLSGVSYAVCVRLRAGSLRAELANPERALGDESRREAIPGRSHAFIEYPRRRRALETSSGVEWGDVVLAMRQELALAPGIEKQLDAADGRLAALLEIAPLPAYFSAPGASRAPLTRAPAIPVAPPFWESTGVVSRERRRFGPAGRMDPEWTIAPLTRSERKAADPYYRDVIAGGEQPALTSAWVPEARQALVTAVSIYDGRVRAVRRSQSTLDAVRLPVFLALWAANDGDEVAVHRVGLPRPQRHSRSL